MNQSEQDPQQGAYRYLAGVTLGSTYVLMLLGVWQC